MILHYFNTVLLFLGVLKRYYNGIQHLGFLMKEYAFNLHALWTIAVTNWVCPELFVLVVSNFLYRIKAEA